MTSPPASAARKADDWKKEFHIAPMMGVTFREFRYFCRLLSRHCILWTEMIVDDTILHTDNLPYHLGYDTVVEPPIICQIGGNSAAQQAAAVSRIVTHDYGYTEINLNAGCPSHRVASQRCFGAALLQNLPIACDMLQGMQQGANTTKNAAYVSIKLRIGVDDDDDWEWTRRTVAQLSTYTTRFYVHARKVLTQGLDAAQNRRIPPLHYPRVYALCREFPHCEFWINGGIRSISAAREVCFGIPSNNEGSENDPKEENNTTIVSNHDSSTDHSNKLPSTSSRNANEDEACYTGLIPVGHGTVPCQWCQQDNGSCITPPLRDMVPSNLRGCLVGRAVMDDPIGLLATLDTDFYNAATNPGSNRRQVLQAYATYLKQLYPRRCGDDWCSSAATALAVTTRPPGITPTKNYYCGLCQQGNEHRPEGNNQEQEEPPLLIHRHVVGRAFKPVQGVFSGVAGVAKTWRRLLQHAMQDKVHANCGPGFLLERAMQQLEDGQSVDTQPVTTILDKAF